MTQEQIKKIVDNINAKLDQVRSAIYQIEDVCDPEYYKGRSKYPVTAVVYTAFDVERQGIPGFQIQKVQYGGKKKMYLPELINDEMLIQVYGDGADPCSNDEVKTKLNLLGDKLHIMNFKVDNDKFTLSLLRLLALEGFTDKGNARIKSCEILYDSRNTN